MYQILQKTIKDKHIKRPQNFRKGSWIYIENPTEEELKVLHDTFQLDASLLEDALDPFEVPRLEIEDGIVYVFTRAPQKNGDHIISVPVLIVVADEFLATVSSTELLFFEKLLDGRVPFYTTQKTKLFIQLFAQMNNQYTQFLTDINRQIRKLSIRPEKIRDRDIFQFVSYEETLNLFLADLTPTSFILKDLLSGKYLTLFEHDKNIVEDLLLSTGQLIETAKSNLKTIVNIREAYQTVVTNNLNRVIKLLTVVTVFLTIPTFIASLFGMNVQIPFENDPNAFIHILEIIAVILTLVFLLFIKRIGFRRYVSVNIRHYLVKGVFNPRPR